MQKKNKSSWQIAFKIHYKTKVINYLWKDKHADRRNRSKNPELELHFGDQLIFWQQRKLFNRERKVFTTNGVGTTGYTHEKKLNLNLYLTSYMKINSRLTHIYLSIKEIKLWNCRIKDKQFCDLEGFLREQKKRRNYSKLIIWT